MARPVILAVDGDEQFFRQICAAFDQLLIPHPFRATTGEEAVLWVGANTCDLCILNYELSGINGIEALIRMRQRKPGLPIIVTSSDASESNAIAAFRQGIVDFIPKQEQNAPTRVAERVQEFLQPGQAAVSSGVNRRSSTVPYDMQKPTYQNRLRVIGRQLDWYGYRSANIVEVEGGFLVRALKRGQRMPEALEFTNKDFPHLAAGAYAARGEEPWERPKTAMMPTGYEDFLRALGHRLDLYVAEAISIAEFEDLIVVGGVGKFETFESSQHQPFHLLLREDDTAFMLDEAFRRRAPAEEEQETGGLRRFLRRP